MRYLPALFSAKEIFGNAKIPAGLKCLGWRCSDSEDSEPRHFVPKRHDEYVFRDDTIVSVVNFLNSPNGDALFLAGPTGSGKTSIVLEAAARLSWPVQEITCSERFESQDLIGTFVLMSDKPGAAPTMRFRYGVLPTAMREGHILLINEFDVASPGELAALNTVLEGGSLTIRETGGEVIKPHPMFRIIVTGNSVGQGDATGMYQGVVAQNLATMDRFRLIKVDYPDIAVEKSILSKAEPELPMKEVVVPMVKAARTIRKQFIDGEVPVTFSTRTLLRWANLIGVYKQLGYEKPVAKALDEALLNRVSDPAHVSAITESVRGSFPEVVF